MQTVQRKSRGGQTVDIQKPTVIIDYTARMGGVDRADQLCTSYNFARKTLKWWRKLFYWLFEVSIVNSYILFNIARLSTRGSTSYSSELQEETNSTANRRCSESQETQWSTIFSKLLESAI